ncbi:MAG: DUF3015 domain-containing protein [Betaproteobacteria bacterium]|nr:DUF3015 domain-containing protein [Betaproteobacteria bacterium]
MKRFSARAVIVASALVALPLAAHAAGGDDDVGSCGWGSKLWDGQSGLAAKVLAVTTNGTSYNQTFGITSGTSGCTQDGTVNSNWKLAAFIDGNKDRLARDMSRGSGETLDALAQLIGVRDQDKAAFVRSTRDNFGRIFPSADASTQDIRAGLREVLAANGSLSGYVAHI